MKCTHNYFYGYEYEYDDGDEDSINRFYFVEVFRGGYSIPGIQKFHEAKGHKPILLSVRQE